MLELSEIPEHYLPINKECKVFECLTKDRHSNCVELIPHECNKEKRLKTLGTGYLKKYEQRTMVNYNGIFRLHVVCSKEFHINVNTN